MSCKKGASTGELARRAIEAYTSGRVLSESEEESAARALLEEVHNTLADVLKRIDASLAEVRERERTLARAALPYQVILENTNSRTVKLELDILGRACERGLDQALCAKPRPLRAVPRQGQHRQRRLCDSRKRGRQLPTHHRDRAKGGRHTLLRRI